MASRSSNVLTWILRIHEMQQRLLEVRPVSRLVSGAYPVGPTARTPAEVGDSTRFVIACYAFGRHCDITSSPIVLPFGQAKTDSKSIKLLYNVGNTHFNQLKYEKISCAIHGFA